MRDKGKWIFHSLSFGINIEPSAFLYVLGKVWVLCIEFALTYLDDIMIFSRTWEENLKHLEAVFKQLEATDLKIKHNKCEFFKIKVHYLGFLISINGVLPLPEEVATIQALEPPRDVNKLRQFLGLIGFYRKLIPFFSGITICVNKMFRKWTTFNWTEQCETAFKLLKAELAEMPALQYPNPNKPFKLFTDVSKQLLWNSSPREGRTSRYRWIKINSNCIFFRYI